MVSYQNNGVGRNPATFVQPAEKGEHDQDAHHPAGDGRTKEELQDFIRTETCRWTVVNFLKLQGGGEGQQKNHLWNKGDLRGEKREVWPFNDGVMKAAGGPLIHGTRKIAECG